MIICLAAPMSVVDHPEYRSFVFEDDGTFPNNGGLPLIILPQAIAAAPAVNPETIETSFKRNGWDSAGATAYTLSTTITAKRMKPSASIPAGSRHNWADREVRR